MYPIEKHAINVIQIMLSIICQSTKHGNHIKPDQKSKASSTLQMNTATIY